jgi:hypothetical protein
VKAALFGLWLCLCTMAGTLIPHPQADVEPTPLPPRADYAALPFADSDLMAVTDIRDGAIAGYFLVRFTAVLDNREQPRFVAIEPQLLADAVYRFFETHEIGEISVENGFATAALRQGLRDEINRLSGASVAVNALIGQVDYLTFAEVRHKSADRTLVLTP